MENEYIQLQRRFTASARERDHRRIELTDRGFRAWKIVLGEPVRWGVKFHGLGSSSSSEVCRLGTTDAGLFTYGPVTKDTVCLRRILYTPAPSTPIAVRLDTSWLEEDVFFARVEWLLESSVAARAAYEQGLEHLRSWGPKPFTSEASASAT